MPDNDVRTPLTVALAQACEFAIAHGVEPPIGPDDFGIRRIDDGLTCATYVDADHAVSVTVEPDGETTFAVAELDWIHDQADDERDSCDFCEAGVEYFRGIPLVDVHLPGDAPEAVNADA